MPDKGLALAADSKGQKTKDAAIRKVVTKKLYGKQSSKQRKLQDDICPNAIQATFDGIEIFFTMIGRVLMIIPAVIGGVLYGLEAGLDAAGLKKASSIYKRKEA